MPTAASIQILNDANGTAHAFLEDDGFLWQCQWNAEAQRWDKGQVVPMAYGGEQLQALLVEDLFPTGGSTGDLQGNTPGIVLAYRTGKGSEAQIYASFGQWGSDGELQWSAPLALTDSALAKEDFNLLAAGDGSFKLVVQQREPRADITTLADALRSTPSEDLQRRFEEALSDTRSDSDLSVSSFRIDDSGTALQINLAPANPTGDWQNAGTISAAEAIRSATQLPLALGGNTQLDRAQLTPAATGAGSLAASAGLPGAPQSNFQLVNTGLSKFGVLKVGLLYGKFVKNYEYIIKEGPGQQDLNDGGQQILQSEDDPQHEGHSEDQKGHVENSDNIKEIDNSVDIISSGQSGTIPSQEKLLVPQNESSGTSDILPDLLRFFWGFQDNREKRWIIKGYFGGSSSSAGLTSVAQFKTGISRKTDRRSGQEKGRLAEAPIDQPIDQTTFVGLGNLVIAKSRLQQFGGDATTYYSLAQQADGTSRVTSVSSRYSAGYSLAHSTTELATASRDLVTKTGSFATGFLSAFGLDSDVVKDAGLLRSLALLPLDVAAFAQIGGVGGAIKNKSLGLDKKTEQGNRELLSYARNPGSFLDVGTKKDLFYAGIGFFSGVVGPAIYEVSYTAPTQLGVSGVFSGEYNVLRSGIIGYYGSVALDIAGGKDKLQDQGFWNAWSSITAGVALPFGNTVPLLSLYFQKPAPPLPTGASLPAAGASGSRQASYTAPDGSAYPLSYAPPAGSPLFSTAALSGNGPLAAGALPLIGDSTTKLQLLSLSASIANNPAVALRRPGQGLLDGNYSDVPILALSLPGSAPATLSFSVSGGQVVASSITITVPAGGGSYIALPETQADNGIYVLSPDVFSTGILPNASSSAAGTALELLQQLPIITVDTSITGSPLKATPISAVPQAIPLTNVVTDASTGSYPERDPATGLWAVPAPGDNSIYTYFGVETVLAGVDNAPAPMQLNSGVTATVTLSGGRILSARLDQPIFLDEAESSKYTLELKIKESLFAITCKDNAECYQNIANPVYSISSQSHVVNNLVEDEGFSPNPIASSNSAAAAVWLSAGINDELGASPEQANWPVQNRVSVVDATGKVVTYLNATSANGAPRPEVTLGQDSINSLLIEPASFSAASTPTAITIAGNAGDRFHDADIVFWVEASDPVIPQISDDGTQNYQAFMEALYGSQRINYRIFKSDGWQYPNLDDLYTPENAVIRQMQAFRVSANGQPQTLLVWDETPIEAIKEIPAISLSGWIDGTTLYVNSLSDSLRVGDLISGGGVAEGTVITAINNDGTYGVSRSQSLGDANSAVSLQARDLRPATVLKAGFINANASSYQWNDLFKDSSGQSTIQTIPWNASDTPGLGIEAITAATQLQRAADGSVVETPVLSWSQAVRTPYREAVLNSKPFVYLDLGALTPGLNSINLGSAAPISTTTQASDTGLNLAIRGALPKATASAVQNIDGTGVLATGTGTNYGAILGLLGNATPEQLADGGPARLQGSLSGTTLTVTSLTGSLRVGEVLSGVGLLPGTTITAIGSVDASGLGTYSVSQAQTLASSSLLALPLPTVQPYSSFSGSISGTSLSLSQLSGRLQLGDQVLGDGILPGTTITAIGAVDASGNGTYMVNREQTAGSSSAPLALAASPAGSSPYTVEFWTQLRPGSNPMGGGLVAFGQPSAAAVGEARAPSGWLLVKSFVVEPISYGEALQRSWISDASGNDLSDLYGWSWAVRADGANTTAMGGDGGSNLYSNALRLSNLVSGRTLAGITPFLANYGLTPADLGGGLDGIPADTIAAAPLTQLQFNNALDPATDLPVSNLNGIAIDTTSAELNQGVVRASDLSSSAKAQQLTAMFEQLWAYQQQTGEAKVNFSLAPDSEASTQQANLSPLVSEQYVGYELDFSLFQGVAVSVDGQGRLVFDVAPGVSLTSSATGTLPGDLRDGDWHHVVASFLPDYRATTIGGESVLLPSNVGTASLVIDNQPVASASGVINPFPLLNLNDNALLLANNAGGAIDQVAFYNQALSLAPLQGNGDGNWPQLSAADAEQLLQELGIGIGGAGSTPGVDAGGITEHWLARNVNPNDAALATRSASFLPDSANPLAGTWTEAAPLKAVPALQATPTSASAGSLQNDLLLQIKPDDWTAPETDGRPNSNWSVAGGTGASGFNPAGEQLQMINVTLTPSDGGAPITRSLTPQQVLIGASTIAALQPRATTTDLHTTLLSAAPALNLRIARQDDDPVDSANTGDLDAQTSYSASVALHFADGKTVTNNPAALPLTLNSAGSSLITDYTTATSGNSTLSNRSKALATAEVIEAAPLQLKYIDSGVVLNSASSTAAANSPAAPSPARSFGQSQVIGSFATTDSSSNTTWTNGWIAIAQPFTTNAISNPAGRVWIQYTGQSNNGTPGATASQAPSTWLNALARSNFSPEGPNRPLLNDAYNPSPSGGLLIQADATAGWGQNFGQTMLVAHVNDDTTPDLIIGAPQANGGGRVVIIDGTWIQANLTNAGGQTVLNLANPASLGPHVTILTGAAASGDSAESTDSANFGDALAFDGNTLWIGAPNYRKRAPDGSLVPVGAVYSYKYSNDKGIWGTGVATALSNRALGIIGSTTSPDPTGSPRTEYWGAQLGTAIAVDGSGKIAISAPGVQASLLYSGTEAVQEAANGERNPSDPYGMGALVKIELPQKINVQKANDPITTQEVWAVSSTDGTKNQSLQEIVNQDIKAKSDLAAEESTYMQNLKDLQTDNIAGATLLNNQAIQTGAVGAVYLFNAATDLSNLASASSTVSAESVYSNGATFYGPQPWNTLQQSGFGSSLAFADLSNSNTKGLVIGAAATGGPGAIYALDPRWDFINPENSYYATKSGLKNPNPTNWLIKTNLGNNQYLAHLASSLTLYGADSYDQFGNSLVNLGDTDGDLIDDLLIQAFNANSGAGTGTVLFGKDYLFNITSAETTKNTSITIPNAATGSVAPGSIGTFKLADGSSFTSAILSELGAGSGATGQGTFGAGNVNGDRLNDIPLGAGNNGQAYLTYGQEYLKAISNLQLQKLASNTGYRLTGLATTTQGSLRSIGDFNGDGYGDFVSIQPGTFTDTVRIELGANTEEILADYPYNFYTFQVAPGTQVLHAGDTNGDGYSDIALFLQQNLSTAAEGNAGAGSTTGILYGRPSEQLPLGSGFGLQAPVDESSAPLASLTSQQVSGAFSTKAPAMLAVGNTIYAVWVGEGTGSTNLWFAESRDGGQTWLSPNGSNNSDYAATKLTAYVPDIASSQTPSLAWFNDKLYLGFVNQDNQLAITSWDPSSGNTTLWGNPKVLTEAGSPLTSNLTPSLISDGTYLSVIWVDPDTNTLQGSTTSTPDLSRNGGVLSAGGPSAWSWVPNGQSPESPALANDGATVYMAHHGENNRLYWTSSSDGGQSWRAWQQLPDIMKTDNAPSLAIVDQDLFIIYKGYEYDNGSDDQRIHISKLEDVSTNQWSNPAILGQTARDGLSLAAINERVNNSEGLAIYYVANNDTGTILRTWSDQPLNDQSWQSQTTLNTSSGGNQTASGALAVTRFNNQTYLAYQGGTPKSASTVAYITTASNPSLSASWEAVANRNTGNQRGIGLSSDDTGLLLNTTDTGFDTYKQTIYRYDLTGTNGWTFYTNNDSVDDTAKTAALLALPSSGSTPQLLLAAANPGSSDRIETSVYYPLALNNSWSSPTPLKERLVDSDGTPFPDINATAAVTTTLLNGTPVLAVNNSGVISIYVSNGSKTFSLASSFNTGGDGSTAAGITTTESGLALSYRNSDGTVSLQRLNFLQLDGTPVDGVVFNADGSLDTSNANLQWQEVKLGANNGLSTGLATAPLSANGMLLLGSTNNGNQVQLNAIPSLSNPDSTTWLNSTVQLPNGQGGWTLQQLGGGSSLSAVGDITGDGNADLLVTAAAVQGGGSTYSGLRLISGAATSSQILTINDATASSQTVQVATSFGGNTTTPVATLSGTIGGQPQLTLSATDSSTGVPYSLGTSFKPDDFWAIDGDLASAQTVFSAAAAPVAEGPGLGLGFGDLSLSTSGSFGDLNADGYLDSLEGTPTTVYGANGLGWHVWSIRAAGDVNGNGTDDLMLSLVAPETVLNGAPQWIQPALVDGALFEVDTATNSFSFNRMRRALNPDSRLQLQDLNSTSSTQPWPLLQNWLEPILGYEHSTQNSFQLVTNKADAKLPGDVYGSVSDDSGMLYLFSSNRDYDNSDIYRVAITKYDPYTGTVLWHNTLPENISVTQNINASSAIMYEGYLYYLDNTLGLHAIKAGDLTEDRVADPAKWAPVAIAPHGTDSSLPKQVDDQLMYGGSIVNEGDRIGLYYVGYGSPSSTDYYNLVYVYIQPRPGDTGIAWKPGTDERGLINGKTKDGDIDKEYGNQIYVQINHGTGFSGEVPVTRNTAATRFNGETYVAYVTNDYKSKDTYNVIIVKRPDSNKAADWATSEWVKTGSNAKYLRLDANQTQLQLSTLIEGNTGYSRVYSFDDRLNILDEKSIYGESGFQINTQSAFMVGSQLTFVDYSQSRYPQSIATPWSGAVQQSLAGYSIDGNIDVNGDGFMDMLVSDPSDPSKNVDNQYVLFGGDYLNIASQVGTPGDDVMLGTTLADVIYSIQGADQVFSNGGKDVIYTGAGDDQISIVDNAFIRIDAGSGFDALRLEGLANQSYDFRLNVPDPEYFAGTKLRDIELISSLDYGANTLSFDAAAINAINADRVLFVVPDAADSIALTPEFSRNSAFDTSFGGTLWSAYAAAPASATPADTNPALLYVATPTGQTADWLTTHVSTTLTASPMPAANLRAAATAAADPLGSLPTTNPIASRQTFGDGLTLLAYRSDPASGVARFAIERGDSRRRQVIAYASSSVNSFAEPGRQYTPACGLLVLDPGQSRQEITVPLDRDAFDRLRRGSLSLAVEELADRGHKPLHLLLEPQTPASGGSAPPALSGFSLTPGSNGEDATLRFRADSNAGTGALESLRLSVSRRRSADSNAIETSQILDILDARPGNGQTPAAYDAVPGTLALDNDQLANRQIATQLELLFTAADGEPSVRLAAPALAWQSTLLLADDLTLQFSQDTPFTLWRADNGTAPVTFGLQAGSQSLTLLNDATGGSSGSINPQNALNSDPLTGWLASEGLAVGSRTVVGGLLLSGITWTPTASSNGQQLALLDLNQEGNQITARFSGGITAVFGLQGTGQAPSPTPILPAVEVQRLAGYDNALAFYALDSVTGMVDGINPGEAGYLQKALARSEASGLLLRAGDLPAYGASRSYTDLPLDPSRSYGALLLVNGDRSRLYSSFAAANPGGVAQMINLGNSRTGLVLGFEDLPATSGDADYNDLVVNIANVSVPVF